MIHAGAPRSPLAGGGPLVVACLLVLGLFAYIAGNSRSVDTQATAREENYNRLLDGFRGGHLSMDVALPPGFERVTDPRDPAQSLPYHYAPYWLHDLSYFHGRFYQYFGAAPVLVLFGPWRLLTGRYLPQRLAVGAFGAAGFLAGVVMLAALRRRYFREVGPWTAAAGALILGVAAGAPILLQRPEYWEVAVMGASALVLLSLLAVWQALERPDDRAAWLAAGSLAYGLAIGARPTVLFGAGVLLLPVAAAWRERVAVGRSRTPWGSLAAAAVPLALCGLAIAAYNAARFGDPFQFGDRYQMTLDPPDAARHFHAGFLGFNLRAYLLAPATWMRDFPFVGPAAGPRPPAGHMPIESVFGVLPSFPVLVLAAAAPLAWWRRPPRERRVLRLIVGSAAALFATGLGVLGFFHGVCFRYEMDFLPALALLAVVGIFALERVLADRPRRRRLVRCAWAVLLAYSIAFNLLASVGSHAALLCQLGLRRVDDGRPREAVEPFQSSLRLAPHFEAAAAGLGRAYFLLGRTADAARCYEDILRWDPDSRPAHYRLGVLYTRMGRFDDALAELRASKEIEGLP